MSESRSKIYRLLHVDDSDDFLEQFYNLFHYWFEIVGNNSANQALKTLENTEFHCVILDYEMPGTNGLELLETIRSRFPDLPVILYTGQGNELVARHAFKAGASDYFVKDIKIIEQREKLINTVKNAIEKQNMECQLIQERALLDNIIELNPYSIQIFDSRGNLVRQNRSAAKLFGLDRIPSIDLRGIISLLCKNDPEKCFKRIRDCDSLRTPAAWINLREFDPQAPDKTLCLGSVAFSLKNNNMTVQNHVIIYEDTTDQMSAQEELQNTLELLEYRVEERTAQLAKVVTSLEDENERRKKLHEELTDTVQKLKREIDERRTLEIKLNHKNKELEEFAFRISHDLRNSILILKRLSEDSIREPNRLENNFTMFLDISNQLIKYTEDLLELAKAGKIIREKSTINLYDLVRRVYLLTRTKSVKSQLVFEDKEATIYGEHWSLENAVTNLIMNSFKYRDPEKEELVITVTHRQDDRQTVTVFSDNGIGVENDFLENLFVAGYKIRKSKGSGFGLTITKKIVEAHGGKIAANSEGEGKGIDVIITLPINKNV